MSGADASAGAHVAILMAVRDGAACIGAQLESFAAQDHRDWRLLASDDASSDASPAILADFAERMAAGGNRVICLDGPAKGAAENFLFLLRQGRAHCPEGCWIAFSDQDDVWLPDRLSRGLAALGPGDDATPALYCSRTWITDAALEHRRLSAPRPRPPGFRNALVQNIAAGNTILLNPAAMRLAFAAAQEVEGFVIHDWWLYQIVTGAGGRVVHDDTPTLLYRQHGGNEIGANDGWRARLRRIAMIVNGRYRDWNTVNLRALAASAHRLTPENRRLLEDFARMREAPLFARIARFRRLRIYRQSRPAGLALWLAMILRRI